MANEIYQQAIKYAKMGLAVFPVRPEQKRPYTPHGCKDAKTDPVVIREWWRRWPNANIGIATGKASGGLIVIDLDIDDDKGINGRESLTMWERENGELPDTWIAITGRGGSHYYYRCADAENIKNRTGLLEGVDVRGEGGYVVAPPSIHENGATYEWEYDPDEFELAEADATVMKLLRTGSGNDYKESFVAPAVIETGKRNDTLFKIASSLQQKGLADDAVYAAVMAQNMASCEVPLDEKEVRLIVDSALEYKKGELAEITAFADGEKWHKPELDRYTDKNGNEKVRQTIKNIIESIEYDKELWMRIRYNTLAYAPYVYSSLPWNQENQRKFREWTNTDDSNLKSYIEHKYGFKSLEKIMEALKITSFKHKYNPVTDLLERCLENWDGKPHIRDLLPKYLGADDTEYTYEVMKITMLGALCRAYYPGCKFDYTPVFVGGQGIGKSTFVRYLALNDDWFNDNFNTIDGDKAAEKLRGMWILEFAELLATKKAKEVESIKAFLTSRVDTYRPPYERRTEQRKRCCIFIGTTNNYQFLTDRTGNRRFLPVLCNADRIQKSLFDDEQGVRFEFAQAWGEAMNLFVKANKHPPLVLPRHMHLEVEAIQERFLEEDPRVGIIQSYLDEIWQKGTMRVCVQMIAEDALGYDRKLSRMESNQIHEIMQTSIEDWVRIHNENGGRVKFPPPYGTQIGYRACSNYHVDRFSCLAENKG